MKECPVNPELRRREKRRAHPGLSQTNLYGELQVQREANIQKQVEG